MKKVTKMQPGMFVKIDGYKATTVKKWDKTPTALVLRASKTRYLCFNINWMDRIGRKKLRKMMAKHLKEDTLDSNMARKRFFSKLRVKNFPRGCYRVYLKSGLPKNLYQLSLDEFKSALKGDNLTIVGR